VNVENENTWDSDDLDNMKRIACRPIWPSGYGEDIYSDHPMIELSWIDPRGLRQRKWFPDEVRNDRTALLSLPGSPVSLENVNQISHWLTEASGAIRNKSQRVLGRRLATEKEILKAEREKREEASRER
jgi:hypothetical protein